MHVEAKIAPEELFVLTDEQILEIEPEGQNAQSSSAAPSSEGASVAPASLPAGTSANARGEMRQLEAGAAQSPPSNKPALAQPAMDQQAPVPNHDPPAWLAAQMKDPWNGEEARAHWNGVVQAQQEAAAYREVFARPEEARASAERARVLDEFDRAYFGAPGKPAEELSASRSQLARRMMREDPTAFREMVFAGLRTLEEAEKSAPSTSSRALLQALPQTQNADGDAHRELAGRYASFEKAANDDLERSVGAVIEKALQQALPNSGRENGGALKSRLNATIRQEIEKSLQGDQQLGEQVSRLLASRKFDDGTRAQVVRLIGERAAQLVPSASKRVLGDWTQTALSAHQTRAQRENEVVSRRDLAPAEQPASVHRSDSRSDSSRGATRSRGVDYRKVSDEQILEM